MTTNPNMVSFINGIPKAELHVHIEGTLEPELLFKLAQRNRILIPYNSVEELKLAYNFSNLQEFLDIYYQGAAVLIHEADFYDLTFTYLEKLHAQNVVHAEIMFDPQTHLERGVAFETIIDGITRAINEANILWGISVKLILSILRHLSEQDAIDTLKIALPYKKHFFAIGLDSSELGHPPHKFQRVFELARNEGLIATAHAGEEGPSSYVRDALDLLLISRIDHGNRSLEDPILVEEIVARQIPLTLCPLSNLALKVISRLEDHPLQFMLDKGMLVTVNSDDPAYFGGHLNDNYIHIANALQLQEKDVITLAHNSFKASFLSPEEKDRFIQMVNRFCEDRKG